MRWPGRQATTSLPAIVNAEISITRYLPPTYFWYSPPSGLSRKKDLARPATNPLPAASQAIMGSTARPAASRGKRGSRMLAGSFCMWMTSTSSLVQGLRQLFSGAFVAGSR